MNSAVSGDAAVAAEEASGVVVPTRGPSTSTDNNSASSENVEAPHHQDISSNGRGIPTPLSGGSNSPAHVPAGVPTSDSTHAPNGLTNGPSVPFSGPPTVGAGSIMSGTASTGSVSDSGSVPGGSHPLSTVTGVPYIIENLPPHLRVGLVDTLNQKGGSTQLIPMGRDMPVNFKGGYRFNRNKPVGPGGGGVGRKDFEPEPIVEGGTPLPFPYNSKDWLGKTPKSYVMEYFQRTNLQPPKWMRESHTTRQLHLIKVTFQDPTGKEITLCADRYFRSIKDAEHNTSILVLAHLIPGAKEPKDIIDKMNQLQAFSKLQKKRKLEQKSMRMGNYGYKNKMYGRQGGMQGNPYNNMMNHSNNNYHRPEKNQVPQKQYENYGYGYGGYTQGYDTYYQSGYINYDYYNQKSDNTPTPGAGVGGMGTGNDYGPMGFVGQPSPATTAPVAPTAPTTTGRTPYEYNTSTNVPTIPAAAAGSQRPDRNSQPYNQQMVAQITQQPQPPQQQGNPLHHQPQMQQYPLHQYEQQQYLQQYQQQQQYQHYQQPQQQQHNRGPSLHGSNDNIGGWGGSTNKGRNYTYQGYNSGGTGGYSQDSSAL